MADNLTFDQRLKLARAKALATTGDTRLKSDVAINDALKRESVKKLTAIITSVAEDLGLDVEKYQNRIARARKSAYGRVSEMITIIASIYAWPLATNSQASEIPELQERMLDTLAGLGVNVDADLLLDIKEAKGFNSFLDESTFTIVDGVEPEYEELEYYLLTFAEEAGLPCIDYKMNESVYEKLEEKALARIAIEQQLAQEALDRHNQLNSTEEVA